MQHPSDQRAGIALCVPNRRVASAARLTRPSLRGGRRRSGVSQRVESIPGETRTMQRNRLGTSLRRTEQTL